MHGSRPSRILARDATCSPELATPIISASRPPASQASIPCRTTPPTTCARTTQTSIRTSGCGNRTSNRTRSCSRGSRCRRRTRPSAYRGRPIRVPGKLQSLARRFARPDAAVAAGILVSRVAGLVRVLFPGAGILVISAWCLGVLNSHGRFLLAYTAPVAWNAAMIATLLLFGYGRDLDTLALYLAWGSVVGSGLQFGVQAPFAWKLSRGAGG